MGLVRTVASIFLLVRVDFLLLSSTKLSISSARVITPGNVRSLVKFGLRGNTAAWSASGTLASTALIASASAISSSSDIAPASTLYSIFTGDVAIEVSGLLSDKEIHNVTSSAAKILTQNIVSCDCFNTSLKICGLNSVNQIEKLLGIDIISKTIGNK